jgi:HEPN domain-containing protein
MNQDEQWWVDASQRDLEMAALLRQSGFHEGAAFHAQQAAGKAPKAILARFQREVRTHSANRLLGELERLGLDISPVASDARDLDRNYIGARYPNGFGGPPREFYDATISERACEQARRIIEFARGQLH